MLERLNQEDFARRLNDTFDVALDPVSFALELVSVEPTSSPGGEGKRQPFSLVFSGLSDELLSQRLYPLRHEELGTLEIFLVPIGPGADGKLRYEAVFS